MFEDLETIAEGVRRRVAATGLFRKAVYASLTNAGQLDRLLEVLSALPAAVVSIGEVEYGDRGCSRTIRPLVIVAERFRGSELGPGIWETVQKVAVLFEPEFPSGEPPAFPEAGGIAWRILSFAPLESREEIAGCVLTLEGTECL